MAKQLASDLSEQLILKISLAHSRPKIWRRVEIFSGLTLHDLHYAIQSVFEWNDSHLYQFLVYPGGKTSRSSLRDAALYTDLPPDPMYEVDENDRPAAETSLRQIFTGDCKEIIYEYDFGDSWEHIVTLEKRTPGGKPLDIPVCLAGRNAAPIDDLGGIGAYYERLEDFRDETSENHDEVVEWLGEHFDPTHFDLDHSNRRLSKAFRR